MYFILFFNIFSYLILYFSFKKEKEKERGKNCKLGRPVVQNAIIDDTAWLNMATNRLSTQLIVIIRIIKDCRKLETFLYFFYYYFLKRLLSSIFEVWRYELRERPPRHACHLVRISGQISPDGTDHMIVRVFFWARQDHIPSRFGLYSVLIWLVLCNQLSKRNIYLFIIRGVKLKSIFIFVFSNKNILIF